MPDSFDEMTTDEQVRWWQMQATRVHQALDLAEATLVLESYTHHAVFKVLLDDDTLILKLALSDYHAQLQSEFDLLTQLFANGMSVPCPLKLVQLDNISALLMTYIYGNTRNGETVTTDDMRQIGEFLATFHRINSDNPVISRRLDWNGLYSPSGIYYPGATAMSVFNNEQLVVIDRVTKKVQSAMDEIGQSSDMFGLIHGDLLLKNLLFHEDGLRALDFEYCGWGYYLYDLTPVLWQLKPQSHYSQLEDALWQGYTSGQSLSERHRELLEIFIAGRQVASMYWVAGNQQNPHIAGKVDQILVQRTTELSAFLKTGKLERQ